MGKPRQPWVPLLALGRGRYLLPRRYDQSASGRRDSFGTLPPEKCSNFKARDSLNSFPAALAEGESILRIYPSLTPQDLAKSRFCDADNEPKYDLSASMPRLLPVGNCESSPLLIPKGNLPFGKCGYPERMDSKIYEIRRNRLKLLVDQLGTGGQTKAAGLLATVRGVDTSPSYVNRMLSPPGTKGRKRISTDMATDIEKAFRKSPGWLSNEQTHQEPPGAAAKSDQLSADWRFTLSPAVIASLDSETFSRIDKEFTQMVVEALMDKGKRAS